MQNPNNNSFQSFQIPSKTTLEEAVFAQGFKDISEATATESHLAYLVAQEAAEKATAMARGALGETTKNTVEVAYDTTETAPPRQTPARIVETSPKYNTPPIDPEQIEPALRELLDIGTALAEARQSPPVVDPNEFDLVV